jgi:predicted helicase
VARIRYHAVPADWTREEKLRYLAKAGTLSGVEWTKLAPDARHNWLREDERAEFADFLPISIPPRQRVGIEPGPMVFRRYSLGVSTNRDDTVYAFSDGGVAAQVQRFAEDYNAELDRFKKKRGTKSVDDFVDYEKLKWSRNLKRHLRELDALDFDPARIRRCLPRPFTDKALYFADIAVDEPGHMRDFFPHAEAERENRMIAVTDVSYRSGWSVLTTNHITDLHLCASTDAFQCFPFYTYDGEDGARRENIPLSTLVRFQNHYGDEAITKWDIFHYVYAMLHHPEYRTRYAANLRRELPRIPFVDLSLDRIEGIKRMDGIKSSKPAKRPPVNPQNPANPVPKATAFRAYAEIGRQLADLHVHYEQAAEYPLQRIENPDEPLNWRVEKMRLTKDTTNTKPAPIRAAASPTTRTAKTSPTTS